MFRGIYGIPHGDVVLSDRSMGPDPILQPEATDSECAGANVPEECAKKPMGVLERSKENER